MRKLIIIYSAVCLLSCHHSVKINGQSLSDTLEATRKLYDFRPLNPADAYAFINKYYLPGLDTLRTGRKLFVHPLAGIDFKERFDNDKTRLQKLYARDTSTDKISPPHPPSITADETFSWDSKKLVNTRVIPETPTERYHPDDAFDAVKNAEWRRKYGYGYMWVSYPQYNANTNRLVIRQWLEDHSFCGTGRLTTHWFAKTLTGWKAY